MPMCILLNSGTHTGTMVLILLCVKILWVLKQVFLPIFELLDMFYHIPIFLIFYHTGRSLLLNVAYYIVT
jgi:hypothetical protein